MVKIGLILFNLKAANEAGKIIHYRESGQVYFLLVCNPLVDDKITKENLFNMYERFCLP